MVVYNSRVMRYPKLTLTSHHTRYSIWMYTLLLFGLALLPAATQAKEATPSPPLSSQAHFAPMAIGLTSPTSAVGDPITRIQCPAGYTATIYAEGLSSPDGLAFSPTGVLHVAEETTGQVSRIEPNGTVTTILAGLDHPEGIAFDDTGNLYIVEDVPLNSSDTTTGRLLRMAPDTTLDTLATGLDAPEGVVWSPDGTIYFTESTVQFSSSELDYRTRVKSVIPPNSPATVLSNVFFWSYAGITLGPDGLLYVTNEAAPSGSTDSVFIIDPTTDPPTRTVFASNLTSAEGLRFSSNGDFPLYVVEEDIGGGAGRLSQVEADGTHTPFCTGFFNIEDVAVDQAGRLYVSEDTSGLIIMIDSGPPSACTSPTTRFAVIGDYGSGFQAEEDVANRIKSWNPDFIITVGDNNYENGSAATIDDNIGQFYQQFIGNYTGTYGPGATSNNFYPTLGNHDWQTTLGNPPLPQPYLDYFTLPGNERYYNFTRGSIDFFALDSDPDEPDGRTSISVQATWLQDQLATATSPWKLVYFHHAPYSSGADHGSNPIMQWPFEDWGASAVLAGHDHTYERIILNGFPYFVNGLGGKSADLFGTPVTGSELRYSDDYGAMWVTANDTCIDFQFINRAGTLIDSYSINNGSTQASIGDFVWDDVNGDGIQDAGESGLAGVTVYLDQNSNATFDTGEPFAVTDSNGAYGISGLTAGAYTVSFDITTTPPGYVSTTGDSISVNLAENEDYNEADFGFQLSASVLGCSYNRWQRRCRREY